jgi:hypothetical protein
VVVRAVSRVVLLTGDSAPQVGANGDVGVRCGLVEKKAR